MTDDQAKFEKAVKLLTALSTAEYEAQIKAVAKKLGVTISALKPAVRTELAAELKDGILFAPQTSLAEVLVKCPPQHLYDVLCMYEQILMVAGLGMKGILDAIIADPGNMHFRSAYRLMCMQHHQFQAAYQVALDAFGKADKHPTKDAPLTSGDEKWMRP
jgi:hypothetical protein